MHLGGGFSKIGWVMIELHNIYPSFKPDIEYGPYIQIKDVQNTDKKLYHISAGLLCRKRSLGCSNILSYIFYVLT